jgi:hypothetical protein
MLRQLFTSLILALVSTVCFATTTHAATLERYSTEEMVDLNSTVIPGDCLSFDQIALQTGWQQDELPWLRKIMKRETGCGRDTLHDGSRASGLLQLTRVHCGWLSQKLPQAVVGVPSASGKWSKDCLAPLRDNPVLALRAGRLLFERSGACNWNGPRYCRR